MPRRLPLVNEEYYHIYNRSIAGFRIYNKNSEYLKFLNTLVYYQYKQRRLSYSTFCKLSLKTQNKILNHKDPNKKLITFISYGLMPTHFHLLLKQELDNGISQFMSLVQNSYTRYFNITHNRKGPLWESRFKSVFIESIEQLLHLTRYIHLNPTSAGLVDKPEQWKYSSYSEYITQDDGHNICDFRGVVNLSPDEYRKFVEEGKDLQRELSIIKSKLIDGYSG